MKNREAIQKLKDQAAALLTQRRVVIDKAEKENRDLTGEEKANWDKALTDYNSLRDRIKRLEDQDREELEAGQAATEGLRENPAGEGAENRAQNERRMKTFRKMLTYGIGELSADERRDLQVGPSGQGGYLVPQEFSKNLLLKLKDLAFVRQRATVLPAISADSLGVPSLDTEPANADWTAELAVGNDESTMAFGKRELKPHPLAKLIKVSKKLIRSSAIPVEDLVRDRLAYKFDITEEAAFMTGSGAEQPLGLFTASSNGIDTSRDTTSANSGSIVGDDLQSLKYGIKAQYRKNARWLINRTVLSTIAQLKDGQGRYIFQPGLQLDTPDTILGSPFDESEYAPGVVSSGDYVAVYGDLSFYWIVDALNFEIQPLFELYAANNQVGFICRREVDGMPAQAEAFARLKVQ